MRPHAVGTVPSHREHDIRTSNCNNVETMRFMAHAPDGCRDLKRRPRRHGIAVVESLESRRMFSVSLAHITGTFDGIMRSPDPTVSDHLVSYSITHQHRADFSGGWWWDYGWFGTLRGSINSRGIFKFTFRSTTVREVNPHVSGRVVGRIDAAGDVITGTVFRYGAVTGTFGATKSQT